MGRGRRDKVILDTDKRQRLEAIARNGHAPAKKILHAQVLLMCDEGEGATKKWTDEEISIALRLHRNTVARIRKRFLERGEEPALNRNQLARRLEIYYTPRNGSWLNIAEIELSVLSQQCLDRRIPSICELSTELTAWQNQRNRNASKVIWRFTTEDARIKLKHLYPVCETNEILVSNAPN